VFVLFLLGTVASIILFRGKSLSQLNLLHAQVTKKITNGVSAGTDVAYWESLAHELKGYRAKVSLQEAHKDLLKRIQEAKKEAQENPEDKPKPTEAKFKAPEAPEYKKKEPPKVKLETRSIQEIEEEKRMKKLEADCQEMYDDKCYTPPLIDKPPPGVQVLEAALEALQIEEKRKLLKNDPSSIKSAVKAIKKDTLDDAFLKEAKKGRTDFS
jgi:hypothetical protein